MTPKEIIRYEKNQKLDQLSIILNNYNKKNKKINLQELRDLCLSKHGLINDDIRRRAWPILLNIEQIENKSINNLKEDF